MLLGFYSGLIIFALLLIIVTVFFIREFWKKEKSAYSANTFMLGVLMLFMLILSSFYTYDFYHLHFGNIKSAEGVCDIKFVNGGGKSIDTTEVAIDNKLYSIKASTYKHLPDGRYNCDLAYLPITKIISEIDIQ
ncbi:cobalamin biosynthesis protein CobN [Solibacillus silvestris]|uniref:cobalamin biosynthesis protein CobN n=1 Tax=Solibacillus silvestris TaxID=76853 RepID=UPI003F7D4196